MTGIPKGPKTQAAHREPGSIFGRPGLTPAQLCDYVMANEKLLRRRLRGKVKAMEAAGVRVCDACRDTDDILSSILRRVYTAAEAGAIRTDYEAEFWAYLNTMTDNLLLERLRRGDSEHRAVASMIEARPAAATSPSREPDDAGPLDALLSVASTEADRDLLMLKVRGGSSLSIAAAICSTGVAVRRRWSRLRRLLSGRRACPPPPHTHARTTDDPHQ